MSMEKVLEGLREELVATRARAAQLEKAIADLGGTTQGGRLRTVPGGAGKPRGAMSAEGKARIAEAQRKRWRLKRLADAKKSRARKVASAARKARPKAKKAARKAVKKVAAKAAAKG